MSYTHGKVRPGLITERDLCKIREAVCVQVEKVYDSCREKDCVENARVLFRDPARVNWLICRAINVKARQAEVVSVFSDVEKVPFKKGFYSVDVKFFIKVLLDFFVPRCQGGIQIITIPGIILFDKKVILFGSEGNVKIFKSHFVDQGIDKQESTALQQDNLPISKIEVAEPIALGARIIETHGRGAEDECDGGLPQNIRSILEETDFDDTDIDKASDEARHHHGRRRVVATVGLFSIVKLARYVQLLIPAFNFCVPDKKCLAATEEDACGLFDAIEFPTDEFFPPQKADFPGAVECERTMTSEE